jgi:hypothetical protein
LIFPITSNDKPVGTVVVERDGDEVFVEFYLNPGFSLRDDVKSELIKDLKKMARKGKGDNDD